MFTVVTLGFEAAKRQAETIPKKSMELFNMIYVYSITLCLVKRLSYLFIQKNFGTSHEY